MTAGARTPEELETILEDAFVSRDPSLPEALFEDHAVLVKAGGAEARGGEAVGDALVELWTRGATYVARTGPVLQARDTALIVSSTALHVLNRKCDGTWRVAISLLYLDPSGGPEDT